MNYTELYEQIKIKKSFLCVGLDSDIAKLPPHFSSFKEPIFEFNREIIDATAQYTIAYKPNLAFYESAGAEGFAQLKKSAEYIKEKYPNIFLIADAKRGDIGNTANQYAKAFFDIMPFDAVTLSPYMGGDSITPFLQYKDKWAIILALTSNKSAEDFETLRVSNENDKPYLFEKVINKTKELGDINNIMYVVGATRPEQLSEVRKIIPEHFLLVPGVGAQGGTVEQVAQMAYNTNCGLIVNSSRGIIFADSSKDFAKVANEKAFDLQQQMVKFIK